MSTKNRLRRTNLLRILESLWNHPNRSRADLARELHLDRSTVGLLVDQMVAAGIIYHHSDVSSGPKGGRPPVLLGISPGMAYSIGVELTYPNLRLAAVDLCGTYISGRDIPIQSYGPRTITRLADEVADFRESLEVRFKKKGPGLVTLGVGVSGQVDATGKSILISHALQIRTTLSVTEPLETALQVPVTLLNDAQAGVLREAGLRGKKELLLIIIEDRPGNTEEDIGIGAGLVIQNRLCKGKAITHLLRPNVHAWPDSSSETSLDLGKSLALVANITGIDEIVLGGDIDGIIDDVRESVGRHSNVDGNEPDESVLVSLIDGGTQAIALGAAYAAMKFLFVNRAFPISRVLGSE